MRHFPLNHPFMRPFEVRRRIGDEGGGRKIMTTLLWEPTNFSVHGPTERSIAELTYHHDQVPYYMP